MDNALSPSFGWAGQIGGKVRTAAAARLPSLLPFFEPERTN
jgi:hypothetical protein